ncbi:hypothetical protein VDGL01_02005 [Verticillium dahliae]
MPLVRLPSCPSCPCPARYHAPASPSDTLEPQPSSCRSLANQSSPSSVIYQTTSRPCPCRDQHLARPLCVHQHIVSHGTALRGQPRTITSTRSPSSACCVISLLPLSSFPPPLLLSSTPPRHRDPPSGPPLLRPIFTTSTSLPINRNFTSTGITAGITAGIVPL